jgi:hypothetical protein
MNQPKTFDGMMSLDESNDVIGYNHHKEARNGVFKGNAPNMHFTTIRGNKPVGNTSLPIYNCKLQGNAVYIPQCNLVGTATYIPKCDLVGNTTYVANTEPNWTFQNYNVCISCVNSPVERDTNSYSTTYQQYRAGIPLSGSYTYYGLTAPAPNPCNAIELWENTGSSRCVDCVSQIQQKQNNPCAANWNSTRWENGGAACNTNPVYDIPDGNGYWTCIPPGSTQNNTIYRNSNPCFRGDQWNLLGTTYATKPPTNSQPSTVPVWVQKEGTSNYCLGVDLYQTQTQINPCAVNYGGVQDIPIETPSNTCAESYSLLDCASGGTGFSIAYPKGTFSLNQRVTSGGATYVINALAFASQAGNIAITNTGQVGCPQVYTIVVGCLDGQTWSISGPIYYSGNIIIDSTSGFAGNQCATVVGQETTASYPQAGYVSSGCACN